MSVCNQGNATFTGQVKDRKYLYNTTSKLGTVSRDATEIFCEEVKYHYEKSNFSP